MSKSLAFVGLVLASWTSPAFSQTCTGNCGTSGPSGVVTAPPGGTSYQYVSTDNGVYGAGQIAGVGGENGSEYVTAAFGAAAGDVLNFNFNFVTSDGGTYADYAFAELLVGGAHAAWLFTARTQPSGNTSPGFGLPANDATLNPGSTPINAGTEWAVLGSDSGDCYGDGCGNTGWINSLYTIGTAGSYQVRFGVTNWSDSSYNSGLAFAGLELNDTPIGAVPEPATWAMMLAGFGAAGMTLRSQRRKKLVLA